MPTPRVSIILPVYNKQDCIERAIRSVLNQHVQDIEIIAVDDGSTDQSLAAAKAVKDDRVTVIEQANQGPGAARNRGAAAANAPLLAFLDGDDEWHPDFLAAALSALDAHPGCLAYVCGYDSGAFRAQRPNKLAKLVDEAGARRLDPASNGPLIKAWVDALHSSCVVVRKDAFDRLGGYFDRDRCLYGEDSFLWLQLLCNGPIYWDPAERTLFHVEDSALGFAQQVRRNARPISLYPDLLEQHCPADMRAPLRRCIRTYVDMDLSLLAASNSFMAAYRLRRRHSLPAVRGLISDIGTKLRRRLTR